MCCVPTLYSAPLSVAPSLTSLWKTTPPHTMMLPIVVSSIIHQHTHTHTHSTNQTWCLELWVNISSPGFQIRKPIFLGGLPGDQVCLLSFCPSCLTTNIQ